MLFLPLTFSRNIFRPGKMPSSIKLTYFDARGRAETSRLILAYAGVAYEDERITGRISTFFEHPTIAC